MNACTITVAVLLVFTSNSLAQGNPNESIAEYNLRRCESMRKDGRTLIIVGSIFAITGGVIEGIQFHESIYSSDLEEEETNLGPAFLCAGGFMIGIGIPMNIMGKRGYNYYKSKPPELSVKIESTPASTGVALTFRF